MDSGCKYTVVVAHECVFGIKFDNGFMADKGIKLPIMDGIDYWAMGDIHTCQSTNLDNGWYCGAPLQFKFDDRPEKGLLLVNLDEPTKPNFIPMKFKPLLTVSKVEDAKEDAYYYVKGELKDVLSANKQNNVIRTEWVKSEQKAIEYTKIEITDGLAQFLADQGCDVKLQIEAIDWVDRLLKNAKMEDTVIEE